MLRINRFAKVGFRGRWKVEGGRLRVLYVLSTPYVRIVRHFETVGHVAGEADIEDGRSDALVLYNVNNTRYQRARLPGKGTAGLEDDTQVRIAFVETLHNAHKTLDVIVGSRHQMTAPEVYPLNLRKPAREFFLDVLEGALKDIGTALAMAVAMKAPYVGGERAGQLVGTDTEARTGGTWIIEQRAHF